MLAHWFGLLLNGDAAPQTSSVGGAKGRPKKRPRQADYFTQPFETTPLPTPPRRNDDDDLLILMALGAL